ncbi:MAG: Rrf2 family transcriptional regulator [Spirochaetales bacterium]|nr:Rrf2 family transcriptional regulator [Spirochaetales bacterium]
MRITTKGRYALRAVLALARLSTDGSPVSIKILSEKEGISPEFLEQIFFKLRKAGLILSVRGPGGGFYFARPIPEISLLEILEASGEGLGIAPCVCGKDETCDREDTCAASGIWRELDDKLREFASARTLAEMVEARPGRR